MIIARVIVSSRHYMRGLNKGKSIIFVIINCIRFIILYIEIVLKRVFSLQNNCAQTNDLTYVYDYSYIYNYYYSSYINYISLQSYHISRVTVYIILT